MQNVYYRGPQAPTDGIRFASPKMIADGKVSTVSVWVTENVCPGRFGGNFKVVDHVQGLLVTTLKNS